MKKGLFIVSMLCFCGMMMAQEVDPTVVAQVADSIKGVHPWKLAENEKGIKPEIAHWSIIPRIGFNAFDGDFTGEMKHNVAIPSAGLAVEYNFTPVWSIGIEYMYNMYNVTGKNDGYTVVAGMLIEPYHEPGKGFSDCCPHRVLLNVFCFKALRPSFVRSGNGIVNAAPSFIKRMTAADAAQSQPAALQGAVFFDGLYRIV